MNRNNISLVVFDIAGTTVKDDNKVGEAFQKALEKYGYHVNLDTINPYMGYEKQKAIREILILTGTLESDLTNELIVKIHSEFVKQMVNYYKETDDLEPLPNVEQTFSQLHNMGIKVMLNTGFSKDIANIIVDRLQWKTKGLVDGLIASDEVNHGRPSVDMIHELMEKANVSDPKLIAKVGDTEVDVNEGLNAGCRFVIGVTTGAYTREELALYNPTHIIDDMSELIPILNS